MGLRWIIHVVGLGIVAIFLRVLWIKLLASIPHSPAINHGPGPCHVIPGIEHGSEDIETLPNGLAFITSGLKLRWTLGDPALKHIKGQIFTFDFTKPDRPPVALDIKGDFDANDFVPHGLSVLQNSKDAVHVYVVNHARAGERVEKFAYIPADGALQHLKTFADPAFGYLNDVVALEEDRFYVTVGAYNINLPWIMFEMLLGMAWGQVVYFDGRQGHVILDRLNSPNGIIFSPLKNHVYLAFLNYDEQLSVYHRTQDNTLTLRQSVSLGSPLDNVDIDKKTGELWVGAHPSHTEVFEHFQYQRETAGSRVLLLSLGGDNVTSVTEVYANTGEQLSASTIASRFGDAILIGSLRSKLLYCEIIYIGK